jgi:hypothetical protein
MPYLTRPTTARTRVIVGNVAEQRSTVLLVNIGKASHDLHLVLQELAVVWRVQGQHPILIKGDWGFVALVYCIYLAFEATVPLTVDARCPYLSILMG